MKSILSFNDQDLSDNLFAVGYLAMKIVESQSNGKELSRIAFLSGVLHGIGKIDPEYQKLASKGKISTSSNGEYSDVGKSYFNKNILYHEVSLLISTFIIGTDRSEKRSFIKNNLVSNVSLLDTIFHSVYWHHAKANRSLDVSDLSEIYSLSIKNKLNDIVLNSVQVLNEVNSLSKKHKVDPISLNLDIDNINDLLLSLDSSNALPEYKHYRISPDNLESFSLFSRKNALNNIIRSSIIHAKSLISELSGDELKALINSDSLDKFLLVNSNKSDFLESIKSHIDSFHVGSKRTENQNNAASQLSEKNKLSILSGPAGSGKTSIGLKWAYNLNANKIYWVTPRVSVAQGLFEEISSRSYLPNSTVEIFTGDYKLSRKNNLEWETNDDNYLSGDIVILTIDQLVNCIVTNKKSSLFSDFMNSHVVFDEYHEYVVMKSYNLLFSELVHSKMYANEISKVLLVSATPNYLFNEKIFNISHDELVSMSSSNKSLYSFNFEEYDDSTDYKDHPLYKKVPSNSIVISNTASQAQKSFIYNHDDENSILYHSKFSSLDKRSIFSEVLGSFSSLSDGDFDSLRSSPVIQASLNITCSNMITEVTTPENTLQRLGRLDRFGESKNINILTVAVPQSVLNGSQIDSSGRFLGKLNVFGTTCSWFNFMKEKVKNEMSIDFIYEIYKDFYFYLPAIQVMEIDLISIFNKSVIDLNNKVPDPILFKPKSKKDSLLKRSSLREDSRYVQLAVIEARKEDFCILNEYATSTKNKMTLNISDLSGDESSLNTMFKKHHQISDFKKNGAKKYYSSSALIEDARDECLPIYASYIPNHIASVNDVNSENSHFYVRTTKQSVGAMRLRSLNVFYN